MRLLNSSDVGVCSFLASLLLGDYIIKGGGCIGPSGYEPVSVDIDEFGVILLCFVRVRCSVILVIFLC